MTLETFVNLSVILTGFSKTTLQPTHDTLKLSEEYFNTLKKEIPANDLDLLSKAVQPLMENNKDIDLLAFQKQIMDDQQLGPIAKNIIQMWYVGIWYYIPFQSGNGYIISDKAYTHGLVWTAMQAHPMGYSEENFGYWDEAPAPIVIPGSSGYGSN